MAKELELKLSLGSQSKAQVVEKLESLLHEMTQIKSEDFEWLTRNLINFYYDTPCFELNQKKMALRVRHTGNGFVQTLKTKGKSVNGISERGEWEWPVLSSTLEPELLTNLDVWPENVDVGSLEVAFETNFVRRQCDIEVDGCCIELALDVGEVRSKGKVEPINELELELKRGDAEMLAKLGRKFIENLSATPSDISKAERGYQLYHQ